ncbi:AAA family ATPase [Iodobacter sp.]|uniref:AAA family ATPase n=1 Tax=Iodobacter sp. TaxID=1915058 RepID=UPI0025EEB52D|nr:AAA family ATPase [Iodobacter sp.]
MSSQNTNQLAKAFFNAFPMSASGGTDESSYYVNRSDDDAHDPVMNIQQAIEWEEQAGSYLFTGLRGVGKTTELNRLITELENAGIAAFYCDASSYLDLTDPNLSQAELVLTALAGLSDAIRKKHGHDILKETIWDRTRQLLGSDVTLKPKLKTSIAGVEAEVEFALQDNPDFKKNLIKFVRDSGEFFLQAQQYALELAKAIRNKTNATKIVLVVDSLERLSAPSGFEQDLFNSLREIFYNDPSRLQLGEISVIYTAPPYLHAVLPNVDSGFSNSFCLPNFKVMDKPREENICNRNADGISRMVNIVQRRFSDWQLLISQPVLENLIWMSGGNVRRLFSLLRHTASKAALNRVVLPITDIDAPAVKQALAEESKPLQWLNADDRKWLKLCREKSGNLAQHISNLEQDLPPIIRLFDHSLILDYQNGSIWYQVSPIVRDHV